MKIKLINKIYKHQQSNNTLNNKSKNVECYDISKYVRDNDNEPILENGFNKIILDKIYFFADKNTKNSLNHSISYFYRQYPCVRYILLNKYTYDLRIEKLLINDYVWSFIDYFEVKFINQITEIKIAKKIPISDEIAKFISLKKL